ncbi:MAG: protoporphyrinogen/coproporphyrinogen oxidase [Acidimicrobiales bacterium]
MSIAVLGGGPAGLATAWRLALAGHQVTLLERRDQVGGLAASLAVGGMAVDLGSHRLHPSIDPVILGEVGGLIEGGLQWRRRRGRVRLAGRWLAYPMRPGDLARNLPPGLAAGAARDLVATRMHSPPAGMGRDDFASVVRRRMGPTLAEHFYLPYAKKLWGLPPTEVDAEAARRRISARSAAGMARRMLARDSGRFWYPTQGGFGAISVGLAAGATEAGVELRLDTAVTGLRLPGGDSPAQAWSVECGSGEAMAADLVISTLPLKVVASLVQPGPPAAVTQAASRLRSRAMVLVYLVLDAHRLSRFETHYLPGSETAMTRLSEPRNYRDGPDPPGTTVICAEIPCRTGDSTWSAADEALVMVVTRDMADMGLDPGPVRQTVVVREPAVYPIYHRGWAQDLAAVESWLASHQNLVTLGRHGLFAHDNTHHGLAMAWAIADCVGPGPTLDRQRWGRARDGFRSHVVED